MENNFWNRVKTLIKEKGITQAQFAEQNGFAINTFLGWISKNRSPDLDIAVNIAKKLDTSVEFLVNGETNELTPDESKLLNFYRDIPEACKPMLLRQAEELASLKGKVN